jgi:tripartite-type tricarboxylate transporter receptor subunit TctC
LIGPSTKVATLPELVAKMKASPGKMTYASGGAGGITHLASEVMKRQAALDVTHVPFRGNGPALTEVMAGRIDMIFDQPASSEEFVKSGMLKPLAVTSPKRLEAYPDIPTMDESGFPGFEASAFLGFAFPTGTPAAIVDRMNREIVKALADPAVRSKLEKAGITPVSSTPAAFGELYKSEVARWRTVITEAKITVE